MIEGNFYTAVALLLWIPVAIVVFRRTRPAIAVGVLMLFGVLFLPELAGFKLPGIPLLTKGHIATLSVFAAALIFRRKTLRNARLGKTVWILYAITVVGALGTAVTNMDGLTFGRRYVPATGPYDTVHFILDDTILKLLPFWLGAAYFRTYEDLRDLHRLLLAGAMIYSIPSLIELRLSPQLHNWTYGYSQHDFIQTIRDGGYRPMVYMSHGLALGLFMACATLSSASIVKAKERFWKLKAWVPLVYLGGLLVIIKSLGAFVYGVVCTPLLLFLKPRWPLFVALLISIAFIVYPFLRTTTIFPDDAIVEITRDYAGEDRAGSIEFRFVNENALLKRARDRLLFGWGGFCRACVFDEVYGDELSVRDGSWIITLGDRGIFGFVYRFGLLIVPLWLAWRRRHRIQQGSPRILFGGLALILGICLLDQLPNGAFNYMPYIYAGALFSLSNGMARQTHRMVRLERRTVRIEERKSRTSMALPAHTTDRAR